MTENKTPERRTKRRYAHELYPHPEEGESRGLAVEVPYLLARAHGFELTGTSWDEVESPALAGARVDAYLAAADIALMADALAQGLTGEEAFTRATVRSTGDSVGEWLYERAQHYGVDPSAIKPYPCGPEPTTHDHYSHGTHGTVTRIPLAESECADCTEPVEVTS